MRFQPLARLAGEPEEAFEALEYYIELGPWDGSQGRSFRKVVEHFKLSRYRVVCWSKAYRWVERTLDQDFDAFDAAYDLDRSSYGPTLEIRDRGQACRRRVENWLTGLRCMESTVWGDFALASRRLARMLGRSNVTGFGLELPRPEEVEEYEEATKLLASAMNFVNHHVSMVAEQIKQIQESE